MSERMLIGLSNITAPPDSLHGLNSLITEKLEKWDVFDFDISPHQFEAIKRIVASRKLKWAYMDGEPEPLVFEGIITLVIGRSDGDFKDHEMRR